MAQEGGDLQPLEKKLTVECFRCCKLGHYGYECPALNHEANCTKKMKEEEEDMVLVAQSPSNVIKRSDKDAWFLDSGCSNHMYNDQSYFSELDLDFTTTVKLGNISR